MPKNDINEVIEAWRAIGPVAWSQSEYGWITEENKPITLALWQGAVLQTWYDNRELCSTLAISNVKKTGKTLLNAILLCYRWLSIPGVHFAVGNDLDQSTARQFGEIADMVRRNPYLAERVKVSKTELIFEPTGSKLIALAADAAGNAGANHWTISHTEAWGIIYEGGIRSYEELTPPPGKRFSLPALRIADSYAGFLAESKTWHDLVDRGLAGKRINKQWPIFQDGGLILFHATGEEARQKCFRGSPEEAKGYYEEQKRTLRATAFIRMHSNERTTGEGSFVTPEAWEACYNADIHPIQQGQDRKITLGADASTSRDFTSLVGVEYQGGFTNVVYCRVWKPQKGLLRKGKPTIDLSETIGAEVIRLHEAGQLAGVVADPFQLHSLILEWEKRGIKVIELAQNAGRVEADQALYDSIIGRTIRHYNDPALNDSMRNAVAVETVRGFRLAKERASLKIDAAVALSMANHGALSFGYEGTGESTALLDTTNCAWEDIHGYPYMTPEEEHEKSIYETARSLGIIDRLERQEQEEQKRSDTIRTFYKHLERG